jgi:hypothetical protein
VTGEGPVLRMHKRLLLGRCHPGLCCEPGECTATSIVCLTENTSCRQEEGIHRAWELSVTCSLPCESPLKGCIQLHEDLLSGGSTTITTVHSLPHSSTYLQIGGSDQWGNITAGTDLIRRLLGGQAEGQASSSEASSSSDSGEASTSGRTEPPSCFGLTFPLLVGGASHGWMLGHWSMLYT